MTDLPLLSILILLPLAGSILCLFVGAKAARWIALLATLACLEIAVDLWLLYDPDGAQWQFVESFSLGGQIGWSLGIDGIALVLIMLTAFLMPICIGASWRAIDKRVPEYMA